MPVIKCNNCGGTTNSAVSKCNYRDLESGALRCYGKWENGQWVKGCAYEVADELHKTIVDGLIMKLKKK